MRSLSECESLKHYKHVIDVKKRKERKEKRVEIVSKACIESTAFRRLFGSVTLCGCVSLSGGENEKYYGRSLF